MSNKAEYLTDMPPEFTEYGMSKVLMVRREIIHLKHIFTEVFSRRSIPLSQYLALIGMDSMTYMSVMTNVMRRIHKFDRSYGVDCNRVVKEHRGRFFPNIEMTEGLDTIVVLDFDGVTTDRRFEYFYRSTRKKARVHICSANPTITEDWFRRRGLPFPEVIHPMKGKKKKLKRLVELRKKHDFVFYVDNEQEYLSFAWLFGIQTFLWADEVIRPFSLKGRNAAKSEDAKPQPRPVDETFKDQRGQWWERFVDRSYFDLICVRRVDDRDFNSATSFHFTTEKEANTFISLIKVSH